MATPDADARSPSQPAAPLPRPPPPTLGGSASAVLAAPVEGKGAATSALTARSARRRGGSSTKTHVDDGLIAEARAHDATALARAMTAAAATSEFDSARLPKARDLIAQMRKSHASLRWNGSRLAPGESYKSGGFHLLCKWPSPLLYLICECQTPASRDARDDAGRDARRGGERADRRCKAFDPNTCLARRARRERRGGERADRRCNAPTTLFTSVVVCLIYRRGDG